MSDEEPGDKGTMPFLAHLDELRTRLRNAAIALMAGIIIAYPFQDYLFILFARPLMQAWDAQEKAGTLGRPEMVFTAPAEAFMVKFKISLLVGIVLATPFIFREIWRFIAPGLHKNERMWGLGFTLTSAALFILGVAFAYVFVLPPCFKFFLAQSAHGIGSVKGELPGMLQFLPERVRHFFHFDVALSVPFDIKPMLSMEESYSMIWMMLLVFGIVFELPLVLAIMGILGIVSAGQLWRFNKYAIMIAAVLGAVVTPGDIVLSQVLMTGSLTVLYNISIVIVLFVGRKKKATPPEDEPSTALVR
jgi:sec-independent protein translocase protein TatC